MAGLFGGGGLKIDQTNFQSTSSKVITSSNSNCSKAIVASTDINIVANNSTLNNDKAGNAILSNSVSCVEKATLTTDITNSLKDKSKATQVDVPGPFTVLEDLLGAGDDINQNNSQIIANQASQMINSLCQNNETTPLKVSLILNNTSLTDVNFSNYIRNNKFNCVIDNMASFYAQNDESNTMEATQVRMSMFIFIALIIAIAVVAVAAIRYGFKSKGKNNDSLNLGTTINSVVKPPPTQAKPPTIPNPAFKPSRLQNLKR